MSNDLFENFGSNSGYIQDMYELYLKDPSLVGPSWSEYFSNIQQTISNVAAGTNGAVPNGSVQSEIKAVEYHPEVAAGSATHYSAPSASSDALQERIYRMVSAFRNRGHLRAKINPLTKGVLSPPVSEDVLIEYYNFTEEQLDGVYPSAGFKGYEAMRLRDLVVEIQDAYCGSIGFEIGHLLVQEERLWLQRKIEGRLDHGAYKLTEGQKIRHLRKIVDAEAFESELHKKYIGHKRFSLQGGETIIPLINTILEEAARKGMKEAVLGMAHRGRLNILRNVLGKPLAEIFSEFEDQNIFTALGSGDVKYHMGYEGRYVGAKGDAIDLTLAPNPSHLEFVYPVVEGIVRAKQDLLYDRDRSSVLSVVLHGDAAFIGQGVVTETLNMANVDAFDNGGTVHLIVNNQIGFTTSPDESRSSVYCTEFAKAIQAPIFHINGDSVEAACWAAKTAVDFSKRYGRDVVLDLYCFRKYGHNEGDDPSYTQPILYSEIKTKPTVSKIYGDQLVEEGVIAEGDVPAFFKEYAEMFNEANKNAEVSERVLGEACALHGKIKQVNPETNVPLERLQVVANTLVQFPDDFVVHPKLQKILQKRVDTLTDGHGIDWGFAEGLAFGTLVQNGVNVRLCGQDCGRGTFSQRHLTLNNYETGEHYFPFSMLEKEAGASFEVFNSVLSEAAVLGYEFGYAAFAKERSLVLWEAQFGDFANGAQVIIDQFISSSEQKWNQRSPLTLMLPHGYEGQGPEHSSARLERFLQLCADGNMKVCMPSSAAQHFHLLRLQGLTTVNRPLIIMTPKSLLRFPHANAMLEELTNGEFEEVMCTGSEGDVDNIVFLSGKVYYDVMNMLEKEGVSNVKVVRLEQLYPFPKRTLTSLLGNLTGKQLFWVQEEPKNMGSWFFVQPRLQELFGNTVSYIGRDSSASTATGSGKRHAKETEQFLMELKERLSV